jgi:hypothetical protein
VRSTIGSPLFLAALTCNVEAVSLLMNHGADPNASPAGYEPAGAGCPDVQGLLGGP